MPAACRCELDPVSLDLGAVLYGQRQERHIILSNTGGAKAAWQFMPLPGVMFGDAGDRVYRPTPRWASVSPQQVRLRRLRAASKQPADQHQHHAVAALAECKASRMGRLGQPLVVSQTVQSDHLVLIALLRFLSRLTRQCTH